MSRATLAAVLALGAALVACGGAGSGAPTDASVQDFCEAHQYASYSFLGYRDGALPSQEVAEEVADEVRDWGEKAAAVGTPAGIPDDARAGFELLVESARGADAPGTGDEDAGDTAPEVVAFGAYVEETCGPVRRTDIELLPGVPTVTE